MKAKKEAINKLKKEQQNIERQLKAASGEARAEFDK